MGVREFEARARSAGATTEKVVAARYALCTLIDETAAGTPWGASGAWAQHGLLALFHGETEGGEKFFQILARLAENPQANLDVLELMYVCLELGFEGRYRVLEGGQRQLDAVRQRVLSIIRKQRGEYERDLSASWQGVPTANQRQLGWLPLWVVGAVTALLLIGIYSGFRLSLTSTSDTIATKIASLRISPPGCRQRKPSAAEEPRLAPFLVEEVRQGRVAVEDRRDRSVVTVLGGSLFKPGDRAVSDSGAGALRSYRRSPRATARQDRSDRPHGQRPDSHLAVSLQLGAFEGARGVGCDTLGQPRASDAHRGKRSWRNRAACGERHRRRPRPEPPSGDRALCARRGRPGRHARHALTQTMRRLARLIFNRWVLLGIGLLAGALLIWWVGPEISISNFRPFETETVRWIQIAILVLTPVGRITWKLFKARRASAALIDGLVQQPARTEAQKDPAAPEVTQLRQRFEEAVGLLRKRRLRRREAVAVDPDSVARFSAIPLRPALVRFHRSPGEWQDHSPGQLGPALSPCHSIGSGSRPRRGGDAGL